MATDRLVRTLRQEFRFDATGGPTSVVVKIEECWALSRESRRLRNALAVLGIWARRVTETNDNIDRCDITVSGVDDSMLSPDPEVVGRDMCARIMAPIEPEAHALVTDFRGKVLGVVVTDSELG